MFLPLLLQCSPVCRNVSVLHQYQENLLLEYISSLIYRACLLYNPVTYSDRFSVFFTIICECMGFLQRQQALSFMMLMQFRKHYRTLLLLLFNDLHKAASSRYQTNQCQGVNNSVQIDYYRSSQSNHVHILFS